MRPEYRRLIGWQGMVVATGAVIAYFAASYPAAKALVFGGGIVLANALFLAWRDQRGSRNKSAGAEWHLRLAYRTAFERVVWVMGMLVVGFKLLGFEPLWMLVGFLGAQAVWLAAPIWMRAGNAK